MRVRGLISREARNFFGVTPTKRLKVCNSQRILLVAYLNYWGCFHAILWLVAYLQGGMHVFFHFAPF
jgi:hypothetical protein